MVGRSFLSAAALRAPQQGQVPGPRISVLA